MKKIHDFWVTQWTINLKESTATHTSGLVARIRPSPINPNNHALDLEVNKFIEPRLIPKLAQEAVKLYESGLFDM